jgi:uncharacterized protein YbaP (TraB family)
LPYQPKAEYYWNANTAMKYLFSLLLAFGFACTGNTQLLYRCSSPGGDTTTYIFGTSHTLPESTFYYDKIFDSILAKTDVYFSEQLTWDTAAEFQQIYALSRGKNYYPPGKSLKDSVTPAQYKAIQAFYKKKYNIPARKFNEQQSLAPFMMHRQLSYNASGNVYPDRILLDKAIALKKPIVQMDRGPAFLVTMRWMQRLWNVDSLLQLHKRGSEEMRLDSMMAVMYDRQDTTSMQRVMVTNYTNDPAYQYNMITIRNREWEKKILSKGGKVNFVVCGMSHVLSRDALLDFFRKRNYTITSIPVKIKKG